MYEALGIITFWIAVIGFFDLVVPKSPRNRISEFIFGFHDVSANAFESAVTDGVLSFFIRDGRWRIWRVFAFSYAMTSTFTVILSVYLKMSVDGTGLLETVAFLTKASMEFFFEPTRMNMPSGVLVLLMFAFCFPLDLFSLWVSKRLFWQKRRSMLGYLGTILLDVCLSLIPFGALIALNPWDGTADDMTLLIGVQSLIFAGVLIQSPTTIFLNFLQLMTLAVGSIVRLFLMATRLNSYTAMHTALHEAPFSFMGLIVGLGALAVSWAL